MVLAMVTTWLIAIPQASAEKSTFRVETISPIEEGDTILARQQAVEDLVRQALLKVVASMATEKQIEEKSPVIETELLSKPYGFLWRLEITGESISATPSPVLMISADVDLDLAGIRKALASIGISQHRQGFPRLLLMIRQVNIDDEHRHGQTGTTNNSEIKAIEVLTAAGFPIADESLFLRSLDGDRQAAIMTKNIDTLSALAKEFGAQLIVLGSAISQKAKSIIALEGMTAAEAIVKLEAVSPAGGAVVASALSRVVQTHIDILAAGILAIEQGSAEAAENLSRSLADYWATELESSHKLTLVVNGLRSIEDLLSFKNELLGAVVEIKSLEKRTYADATAAYDLISALPVDSLAEKISTGSLPSFNVVVRSKSPQFLELNVKPK